MRILHAFKVHHEKMLLCKRELCINIEKKFSIYVHVEKGRLVEQCIVLVFVRQRHNASCGSLGVVYTPYYFIGRYSSTTLSTHSLFVCTQLAL